MSDIEDDDEATLQQLITDKKPFACITYWQNEKAAALNAKQRLDSAGLVTDLRKRAWQGYQSDHVWDLLACHNMRVQDIGYLRALREDYAEVFEMGLEKKEVLPFADRLLSTFFEEWDSPLLPTWLTGLILGYPVENTISLYRE